MFFARLTEIKTILKSLIISSRDGITVDQLEEDFWHETGQRIPYLEMGYRNLPSFLQSMKDTLIVGNTYVRITSSGKSSHVEKLVAKSKPSNYKNNQRMPVKAPCSGACVLSYSNVRKKNPRYNLEDESELQSSFHYEKNHSVSATDKILSKPDIESSNTVDINSNEAVPLLNAKDFVFIMSYPAGVVEPGVTVPPIKLGRLNHQKDKIFVTEIYSPQKFWFHFTKDAKKLKGCMEEIQDVYTKSTAGELDLKLKHAVPGQICAAQYMAVWHRAEILEALIGGKVKVFYIDYGTVSTINLENIRYLLKEFAELPRQARRGCLSLIKPVGLQWTRPGIISFVRLASERKLDARIIDVNKDHIFQMIAMKTEGENHICLNDALVGRNHARYSENLPSENEIVHDECPSFDMLEQGEYPSLIEQEKLLANGFHIDSLENWKSNMIKILLEEENEIW